MDDIPGVRNSPTFVSRKATPRLDLLGAAGRTGASSFALSVCIELHRCLPVSHPFTRCTGRDNRAAIELAARNGNPGGSARRGHVRWRAGDHRLAHSHEQPGQLSALRTNAAVSCWPTAQKKSPRAAGQLCTWARTALRQIPSSNGRLFGASRTRANIAPPDGVKAG
jgi:hypothetical protein